MRSPCAGAVLDPPLWIVPNKLSLSLSLSSSAVALGVGLAATCALKAANEVERNFVCLVRENRAEPTLMKGSLDGTIEPDRHRQETLDLAA
jgi:hypothetical protein